MSGFLQRYQTNKGWEEEGIWVDMGGGVQVKVTRITSQKSREVRRRLEKPLMRKTRGDDLPLETLEYLLTEQLAQAVIVDWRGVTDENGNDLPCTLEHRREILTKFPDFREDVATAAMSRVTFQEEAQEEEMGN